MRFWILSIISFVLSFVALSQKPSGGEATIFGKIVEDKSNAPLEYVSVRLLRPSDSSTIAGVFSDKDGKFSFDNVAYGSYLIRATFTSYQNLLVSSVKVSATGKVYNTGTLKMSLDKTMNLEEVVVRGQLDVLKAGIDKKVFNVDEDLSVRGGTANDVLTRLPSVELDQDGGITLRGEGKVTILIDGRPSSLSGGNGKTLLDALPAGSIERIEIVTNPSAKYDPDGTSGIINIVLKKNKLKGFNGLVSTNLASGNLRGGNVAEGTLSLSFRNKWYNVYGSYNGRFLEGYRNNVSYIRQDFGNDSIFIVDQTRLGTDFNIGSTFRAGADFYLKARNTLGLSMTGNVGQRDRTGNLWNSFYNGGDQRIDLWQRTSFDPSQQRNFDLNVNYKWDFKDDRGNLSFDFNQSLGNEATQGFYQNNYFLPDSTVSNVPALRQELYNKEKNNISTAQLDYTLLMPKINARMEAGAKTIIRVQNVDTYSQSFDYAANAFLEDTLANFLYRYDERIFSTYGIFGQQFGKFKYQGGIRLEQSYQIPDLISDSNRIENIYFNWFPSAHIRYTLKEKSELSLSYSKRINRASAGDLNPFTSYADPFNLRRGNPNLKPEFIHSFDLGYAYESKKFNFTASSYYRYSTGVITRVKEFYSDNTSAVTFQNIAKTHNLGGEIILSYRPIPTFRHTLSWNGNYIWWITDLASLPNRQGTVMNVKYNMSYEFWKKTTVQLSVNYFGPRVTVQGVAQRRGPVDLAIEKRLGEGKWTVGARVSDIFNRQGFYLRVDRPGVYQESDFKWLTRRFYISASYKFGKLEMSNKKSSGGGGGEDM
jgi:outer membrane receptor protein involved in Fe transport